MKKIILLLLCCVLTFGITSVVVSANDDYGISLCNNNVMLTDSGFAVNPNTGYGEIFIGYFGYTGITTGGKITTVLQIQDGDDWIDVNTWEENATGDYYENVYCIQLAERGNYRVQIEYRISGTAGPDDVIQEEYHRTF